MKTRSNGSDPWRNYASSRNGRRTCDNGRMNWKKELGYILLMVLTATIFLWGLTCIAGCAAAQKDAAPGTQNEFALQKNELEAKIAETVKAEIGARIVSGGNTTIGDSPTTWILAGGIVLCLFTSYPLMRAIRLWREKRNGGN